MKYAELLNEYLFVRPMRPRYWQNYKDRWWRLCGTYSYKGKREEVLAAYKIRRKRYGERDFSEALMQKSYLLEKLTKDDVWHSNTLMVPFKMGNAQ